VDPMIILLVKIQAVRTLSLTVVSVEQIKKKKLRPHLEDFDITRVIGKGGFSTVF
jgi:predicted RNA-binding protein YlqC (UPF0109 family)